MSAAAHGTLRYQHVRWHALRVVVSRLFNHALAGNAMFLSDFGKCSMSVSFLCSPFSVHAHLCIRLLQSTLSPSYPLTYAPSMIAHAPAGRLLLCSPGCTGPTRLPIRFWHTAGVSAGVRVRPPRHARAFQILPPRDLISAEALPVSTLTSLLTTAPPPMQKRGSKATCQL